MWWGPLLFWLLPCPQASWDDAQSSGSLHISFTSGTICLWDSPTWRGLSWTMNRVIFTNPHVLSDPTCSFPFTIYHSTPQTTWVAFLPKFFNGSKIHYMNFIHPNLMSLNGPSPCLQPVPAPLIRMILRSPEHSKGLPPHHASFLLVQSCLEWSTHPLCPNWKMPTCLQISPNITSPTKSCLCSLRWRVKWVTYLYVSTYQILIISLPNYLPFPVPPSKQCSLAKGPPPFFCCIPA